MEAKDETKENDILNLNREAMNSLKDQNYSKALISLKKASVLLKEVELPEKRMKLQGITLNNFGCFYKRSKMPNVALKYLTKACLSEKEGLVDNVGIAATHLNMCAIYSELGKHDLALQEGLISLDLMKPSLEHTPNFISTLVIAYHNTGVEYEFLKLFREAYQCYKMAWETSLQHLGPDHPLTLSTEENCSSAEKKVREQEMRLTKDYLIRENTAGVKKTRFRSAEKRPKSRGDSKPRHMYNFSLRENLSPKIAKDVSVGTKVEPELHTMRFLTGERLQPMFKTNLRVSSLPRGTIKMRNVNSSVTDKSKTIELGRGSLNIRKRKIKSYPIKAQQNNTQELNQVGEEMKKNKRGVFEVARKIKKFEGKLKFPDKRFNILEENKKKLQKKGKKQEEQWEDPKENARFEIDTSEIDSLINEVLPNFGLLQMEQSLDTQAALKIQKTFRGYKVRKLIHDVKKPTSLESETSKIIQELNALKIIKQKQVNHFNQEEVGLDIIPEIPDAATPVSEELSKDSLQIVQGLFKGYLVRKDLLKKTKAATFIQKHIRRFVVLKIYKKIREAILFIQSSYRDYIIRKNLKKVNE